MSSEIVSFNYNLTHLCGQRWVHSCLLKGVLEQPQPLLEVLAWLSVLILTKLLKFLQLLSSHFDRFLESVKILETHALAQVVADNTRVCNFERLCPGCVDIF